MMKRRIGQHGCSQLSEHVYMLVVIFLTVHLADATCALRAKPGHSLAVLPAAVAISMASFCKSEPCRKGRAFDNSGEPGTDGKRHMNHVPAKIASIKIQT